MTPATVAAQHIAHCRTRGDTPAAVLRSLGRTVYCAPGCTWEMAERAVAEVWAEMHPVPEMREAA